MNDEVTDQQTKSVSCDININNLYIDDEWANMCEDEYDSNIKDRPLEGSLHENENEKKNIKNQQKDIDIDGVLLIDILKFKDDEILHYEVRVADNLKKCIDTEYKNTELLIIDIKEKNDVFLKKNIINKLKWLMDVSKHFSKKLNLPDYIHKINKKCVIPRSSYKFCNNNYKCEYNYNSFSRSKGCIAKHFVHNMVCADINVLIKYISIDKQTYDLVEIRKSIHTISFVMNHMYEELQHGIKLHGYDKAHINVTHTRKNKFNSKKIYNANNKHRYKSRKNNTRKYNNFRRQSTYTHQLSTTTNNKKMNFFK